MEKITTEEARNRIVERYRERVRKGELKELTGLDFNDYVSVFRNGSEVILLEYYQEEESLVDTLMKHKQEILEQVEGGDNILLQIITSNSHELTIDDINEMSGFMDLLGNDVNFHLGLETEDTSDFKVKMEVYIVK